MSNVRRINRSSAQGICDIMQGEVDADSKLELVVLSVNSDGNFHAYWTDISQHLRTVGMLAQLQAELIAEKI